MVEIKKKIKQRKKEKGKMKKEIKGIREDVVRRQ